MMELENNGDVCARCKWFECRTIDNPSYSNWDADDHDGNCKVGPPVGWKSEYRIESKWPEVCGDNWCGSFRLRQTKQANEAIHPHPHLL